MFHFDLIRYAIEGCYELGDISYIDSLNDPGIVNVLLSEQGASCLSAEQVLSLKARYEVKISS